MSYSKKTKKSVTIFDVAKEAEVSTKTVSRVVNSNDYVSEETRQRVQDAIDTLGYRPNHAARNLASNRSGTMANIALHFPHKHPSNLPYNPLEMDFIAGAAATAGSSEYFFNLLTMPVTEDGLLELLHSNRIDGLILMEIHTHDWRVDVLREHGYPFVTIGHCDDNTDISYIDLDFAEVVKVAFNYAIRLGHRTIGFITPPETSRLNGYGPAVRAWASYQEVLQHHAIVSRSREVSYVGQDVYDATLDLLDELPNLTAIVTTHAYAALSIIPALSERGLRVPMDCSVIALTSDRIADLSSPALTHIEFPAYDMGRKASDMLDRLLKGELEHAEQILIAPRLVIQNSTGRAKRIPSA